MWIARSVTGAFRAVKIVRRSSFDHERPFEREFEGIQKFEPVSRTHDSQVDILHVGRGEDYFYYVMELADDQATGGQINPDNYHPRTLKSDLLFHSRLSFEECVSIGIALTTALEHLHKSGLVHRDVKPSNIIFVNGVAKLADIGLVTGVDTTRSYVGTEGFAAPEGPGTAQGDLFSLGKVLYEMSTGKDRQEFPELPTNLRELPEREGLMELNAVIAKACRHDPGDRYSNAAAMRADLELLQSGKSLARLHRVERRLRTITRAGIAAVILSLLILAGWLYQRVQTREARSLAEHNRELAAEKTRLAEEKTALAEESRKRLVRLNVANGVRLLGTEPTMAALWFSEALRLTAKNSAESTIHRLRIQTLFEHLRMPIHIIPHEHSVTAGAYSADGKLFATGTESGDLFVWDASTGSLQWTQRTGFPIWQLRFTRDGGSLLVTSSSPPTHQTTSRPAKYAIGVFALTNRQPIFSKISSVPLHAAFSPSGHLIAYAHSNHSIRVVDARTGRMQLLENGLQQFHVNKLTGHSAELIGFSFNDDETLLASACADRTVRLWRLPSGQPLGAPFQNDGDIKRVLLSGNGRRLATTSVKQGTNWTVHVRDIETRAGIGPPVNVTVSGPASVLGFVDPAGRRLLIGGNDGPGVRAYFLDVETGATAVPSEPLQPRSWAVSPDGQSVAIGDDEGAVKIFNPQTGELLFPPVSNRGWVESLSYSPDGSQLLVTRQKGTAVVLSLKKNSASSELRFDAAIPRLRRSAFLGALALHQRRMILPLMDGTIRVIDLERMAEVRTLKPSMTTNLVSARFSADGRHWAARPIGGLRDTVLAPVELWRDDNGTLRHMLLQHPEPVGDFQFDSTSTHILTHCGDQHIRIWKTTNGALERAVPLPEGVQSEVRIFPNGTTALLRRSDTRNYELFDLTIEKIIGQPMQMPNILSLDFDIESGRFAAATADNYGRIWNARTGDPLTPPVQQGGTIYCVLWSPDYGRFLTAGTGTTKVWDATTGELAVPPFRAERGNPYTATWSLDRRFIVTPVHPRGRTALVWDARTGEPVTPLVTADGEINLAAVVNNRLIMLSHPNVLQAWDLRETDLPVEIISEFARLLSGFRLNDSGVPIDLNPRELAELAQSLRSRAPQLFQRK